MSQLRWSGPARMSVSLSSALSTRDITCIRVLVPYAVMSYNEIVALEQRGGAMTHL